MSIPRPRTDPVSEAVGRGNARSGPRAPSTCTYPGCDAEVMGPRCAAHPVRRAPAVVRRTKDERPSSGARGYGRSWRQGPRALVLARDPVCTQCGVRPSTVADHHPLERVELVAMGVPDPDAPEHLRGVCTKCHNTKSARRRHGLD